MQTIAVIFGGRSAEHDISIVTALASVIKPLELTGKYKVEAIYIDKKGAWYWDDKLKNIELFTKGGIEDFLSKAQPASIRFNGGMMLAKQTGGLTNKTVTKQIDVVFPAMHGTYGEDGSLMGLLEMAGVPYVGCNLAASVLAMDKVLAKQVAAADGVPVALSTHVDRNSFNEDPKATVAQIEKVLTYPLFVKPAHLGSSIGITQVANQEELKNALEVAAHYDDKIIIEEEVQNLTEVTLPIMGNDTLTPALLERPLTTAEDFFDFETKYMQGGKKGGGKSGGTKGAQGYSELPAKLSESLYAKAQDIALQTYRALGCSGIARVDLLIDSKTQDVYFNEVNPLPGDLYAHNWRASGVPSVDLVQSLVNLAIERHEQRQKLATVFSTNYLQQF